MLTKEVEPRREGGGMAVQPRERTRELLFAARGLAGLRLERLSRGSQRRVWGTCRPLPPNSIGSKPGKPCPTRAFRRYIRVEISCFCILDALFALEFS